jgi:hypothetical protein
MHREGRGRIGGEELTSANDEQPWHDGWGTDEDKASMNGGHGEAGARPTLGKWKTDALA